MIDAQRVDLALGHQTQHQAVRVGEDFRILDTQRSELIDVEEAAVVDVVRRDAPAGEAEGLALEQRVQRVEAGGIIRAAVERRDGRADAPADFRYARDQRGELPLQALLVAPASGDAASRRIGAYERGSSGKRCWK